MRLSHVFRWRGKIRYWDAPSKRGAKARVPARRKYKIDVPADTYEAITALARSRGISRQAMTQLIVERPP